MDLPSDWVPLMGPQGGPTERCLESAADVEEPPGSKSEVLVLKSEASLSTAAASCRTGRCEPVCASHE